MEAGTEEHGLEIRLTLDTSDRELAEERAEKIEAALTEPAIRRQFGEWVTFEVYSY